MIKSMRSAWFGLFQRVERAPVATPISAARRSASDRYPTHARVVLPDGQLMYVRNASLAAAKDLLAAQRAVERHAQAQRIAYFMREAEMTR